MHKSDAETIIFEDQIGSIFGVINSSYQGHTGMDVLADRTAARSGTD